MIKGKATVYDSETSVFVIQQEFTANTFASVGGQEEQVQSRRITRR